MQTVYSGKNICQERVRYLCRAAPRTGPFGHWHGGVASEVPGVAPGSLADTLSAEMDRPGLG